MILKPQYIHILGHDSQVKRNKVMINPTNLDESEKHAEMPFNREYILFDSI